VLCPIKSSECLAFLNPGGRRGDLISEILGALPVNPPSPRKPFSPRHRESAYASFLITPSVP